MTAGLDVGGVGFEVAPGDPGHLSAASMRFATVGDGLRAHATTLRLTAQSLVGPWQGVAAAAYQDVTAVTATHFDAAAQRSLLVSSALASYASDLEGCRQAGKVATREALRCLEEWGTLTAKLQAARQAVAVAQSRLIAAHSQASVARAAGPLGIAVAAAAEVEAAASTTALALAHTEERTAELALTMAEDELTAWRARGRRAWEEAEAAGQRAIRQLEGVRITPPPLAGPPGFVPLTRTLPFVLPPDALTNPGGPTLGGILGFTATPLPRSTILDGREQPKQLSPEEEAAVKAKEEGKQYDAKMLKAAEVKLRYNEKVIARIRNQQRRKSGLRQPPKSKQKGQ